MHKQVLYLAKYLNKEIFEPVVCTQNTPNGGLRESFEASGCKLIDLDRNEKKIDLLLVSRLLVLLRAEKPAIIFITAAPNLFYFRIAKIFYKDKIIQIGSFRAMSFWKGNLKKHYQPIDNFLAKWLYKSSNHTVVNSIALKEQYSKFIKIDSKKPIEVIYNGSDFNLSISVKPDIIRNDLNVARDQIMIIMVARLDPWKDFETLLDAAKIAIDTDKKNHFFILGEGSLRPVIEGRIKELNLESNFKLLGERKDVFNFINAADISVLSSNGEGFPNTVMESMAFGKPVVASDVGGNKELLGTEEKYGILVPSKSSGKLADEILRLSNSETLRREIGQRSQKRIHQLCNLQTYINSYETLFIKSLSEIN